MDAVPGRHPHAPSRGLHAAATSEGGPSRNGILHWQGRRTVAVQQRDSEVWRIGNHRGQNGAAHRHPVREVAAATSSSGGEPPPGAQRGPRSGSGTAASVQCDGHQEGQQRQGDHADAGRVRGTSCVRLSDAVYTHIHNLTRRVCCAIIALEHVVARVQERAISRAVPAALAVRHDVPSGGQRARGEAGECNACTGWRLICGGGCGSR